MKIRLDYSKQAKKFLDKNNSLLTESEIENLAILSVKKIYKLEETNIDLKPLKGDFKGYYRIRKGNIRIIFSLEEDKKTREKLFIIFFAKDIDFRGNIYD